MHGQLVSSSSCRLVSWLRPDTPDADSRLQPAFTRTYTHCITYDPRPHDVPLFAICMDSHHSTSPITSLQASKLHRDIGYVPPTDTGSLRLAVDSTHTVVGLFRLLVRRSGTHCQMNSEIRRVMSTASNSSLKQSCSAPTSVTSALEVIFQRYALYKSTVYLLTYLLTYLLRLVRTVSERRDLFLQGVSIASPADAMAKVSVRMSHCCTVSKRRKLGSRNLHRHLYATSGKTLLPGSIKLARSRAQREGVGKSAIPISHRIS